MEAVQLAVRRLRELAVAAQPERQTVRKGLTVAGQALEHARHRGVVDHLRGVAVVPGVRLALDHHVVDGHQGRIT
ncbi:hypothetical protein KBTX_02043 [wastewater metagenome]|uniref:Uncharacterized protein n=2 Tax=unclassified sequences TaxID=12908 RepID=A0A5B8R993_9ZZZZ|nr:hypothetical protein KBTEX_02043 [uncultured organism]